MKKEPFIEVMIVFKNIDKFLIESVENCLKLNYRNFSILLLPDEKISFPIRNKRVRIIPTGKLSIPKKRNIGIKNALKKTEFIAYVDSDAFPRKNWLKNSIKYFENKQIAAVGGPNLTPVNEEFRRKITGNVMEQNIAFGAGAVRHKIKENHFINELPTCNLIVRKEFLKKNLFDETLSASEDMNLCHSIIKKGLKIMYAKDVVVYHHRRKIILPLLKQFYNYGYSKGMLFFRNQLSSVYPLAPPAFLAYLILGTILSFFSIIIKIGFIFSILLYFLILLISSISSTRNPTSLVLTVLSIFLIHLSYGIGFLHYSIKRVIFGMKKEKGKIISANA